MAEGIGGTIGNLGLRYGAKWLDNKLFPEEHREAQPRERH